MVKYSVVIPVYNVEKYLKECVNSILAQTEKDYEIILIDDGSTDSSGKICDRYAEENEMVTVIHQKNGGLSDARNSGIRRAEGEYLVFLDSDDYLDIGALEHLTQIINGHCYDVVINRADRYDETEDKIYPCGYVFDEALFKDNSSVNIYNELLKQKKFTFTAWIFVVNRKFLLEKELFFCPGLLHEDELWTPYLMLKARGIACNNNRFYYYRVNRRGSIMSERNIKKALSLVFIMEKLMSDGSSLAYNEDEKFILNYRASDIYLSLLYTLNEYKNEGRYRELKERMRDRQKILLYRNSLRDRLIECFITNVGLERFLVLVAVRRYIKKLLKSEK